MTTKKKNWKKIFFPPILAVLERCHKELNVGHFLFYEKS